VKENLHGQRAAALLSNQLFRNQLYPTMSQTPTKREYIVDGKFSQEECIELKVRSREEDILRKLGILHLENKVTRARYTNDESDATILKQAGVSYINTEQYEESAALEEQRTKKKKRGMNKKLTLNRKEAEILRSAGVHWLDNMAVVYNDDTYCHKLGCETGTTATGTIGESTVNSSAVGTVGESTVNSTYAERELLRRLKHGWSSTGEECGECGMPVICKSKGDLFECVICGVVGGEDNYNAELEDSYNPGLEDVGAFDEIGHNAMGSPGVFEIGTNISTINPNRTNISAITPNLEPNERFNMEPGRDMYHCHECQTSLVDDAQLGADQSMYCNSCNEKMFDQTRCMKETHNEDDEAYKEELGLRLFDGWELTKLNCPSCNLPLISEGEGASAVCLRCG